MAKRSHAGGGFKHKSVSFRKRYVGTKRRGKKRFYNDISLLNDYAQRALAKRRERIWVEKILSSMEGPQAAAAPPEAPPPDFTPEDVLEAMETHCDRKYQNNKCPYLTASRWALNKCVLGEYCNGMGYSGPGFMNDSQYNKSIKIAMINSGDLVR